MIPLGHGGHAGGRGFVVNVSADDVMERDIDLEIEARQRGAVQPASASSSYWHKPANSSSSSSRSPSLQRTFSQRMLSTVNKSKHARGYSAPKDLGVTANHRVNAHILERRESRHDVESERPFDASYSSEMPGLEHERERRGSAKDRLDARINQSFLSRTDSEASLLDAHDYSAMYSGRRTYPAESRKKSDARLSEGRPGAAQEPNSTNKSATLARAQSMEPDRSPEVDVASTKKTDSGVFFRFGGEPSPYSNSYQNSDTIVASRRPTAAPSPQAMVAPVDRTASRVAHLDPRHAQLVSQLNDIECFVEGVEGCLANASFVPLAADVVKELERLHITVQQIRSAATTYILAEIGRPQTMTADTLRLVVTRAAAAQTRIQELVLFLKRIRL